MDDQLRQKAQARLAAERERQATVRWAISELQAYRDDHAAYVAARAKQGNA